MLAPFARIPTLAEAKLWSALSGSKLGVAFRRQVVVGERIVDFLAPSCRLVVELDGGYHAQLRRADLRRTHELERLGCRVIRFPNELVMRDLGAVLEVIRRAICYGARLMT